MPDVRGPPPADTRTVPAGADDGAQNPAQHPNRGIRRQAETTLRKAVVVATSDTRGPPAWAHSVGFDPYKEPRTQAGTPYLARSARWPLAVGAFAPSQGVVTAPTGRQEARPSGSFRVTGGNPPKSLSL